MAAPAAAASMQESAIWRGVTGTLSERPVVSPAPVTAQVMKTSRLGCSPMAGLPFSLPKSRDQVHGPKSLAPNPWPQSLATISGLLACDDDVVVALGSADYA